MLYTQLYLNNFVVSLQFVPSVDSISDSYIFSRDRLSLSVGDRVWQSSRKKTRRNARGKKKRRRRQGKNRSKSYFKLGHDYNYNQKLHAEKIGFIKYEYILLK